MHIKARAKNLTRPGAGRVRPDLDIRTSSAERVKTDPKAWGRAAAAVITENLMKAIEERRDIPFPNRVTVGGESYADCAQICMRTTKFGKKHGTRREVEKQRQTESFLIDKAEDILGAVRSQLEDLGFEVLLSELDNNDPDSPTLTLAIRSPEYVEQFGGDSDQVNAVRKFFSLFGGNSLDEANGYYVDLHDLRPMPAE